VAQNKIESPISKKSNLPLVKRRSWNSSNPIEKISGRKTKLTSRLPIFRNKNFDVSVTQNTHKPSGKEKIMYSFRGRISLTHFRISANLSNEIMEINS
jgi:hypothetical protein